MLKKSYLLLEFLREIKERVRRHDILLFCWRDWFSFIIVEDVLPVGALGGIIEDNFRGIIEEDTSCIV